MFGSIIIYSHIIFSVLKFQLLSGIGLSNPNKHTSLKLNCDSYDKEIVNLEKLLFLNSNANNFTTQLINSLNE